MREALSAACYQLRGLLNVIQAAVGILERLTGQVRTGDPGTPIGPGRSLRPIGHGCAAGTLARGVQRVGVPVNVNELLRQVLEIETDRLLATGIVVEWQPALMLARLTGHENQLRSMFNHLIDNAF